MRFYANRPFNAAYSSIRQCSGLTSVGLPRFYCTLFPVLRIVRSGPPYDDVERYRRKVYPSRRDRPTSLPRVKRNHDRRRVRTTDGAGERNSVDDEYGALRSFRTVNVSTRLRARTGDTRTRYVIECITFAESLFRERNRRP